MGKFRKLAANMYRLNIDAELYLAVKDEQKLALDFNIKQLDRGEYSDGSWLPEYSDVSVEVFGKEPGPFTLEETGAFKKGFEMIGTPDAFRITSYDTKIDKIIDQTNEDIFGLQPSNLTKFAVVVKKNLAKRIKQAIKV